MKRTDYMSYDAVCELLKKLGGKEYPSSDSDARMFGFGHVQGPKCVCNEKPPEVVAVAYSDVRQQGMVHPGSVVFNLVGEMPDQWCDVRLYAISREDVEAKKDVSFRTLEVMWRAGFAVMDRGRETVVCAPESLGTKED